MKAESVSRIVRNWVPLCLCILLCGCGYRFAGSGGTPKGLNTIFISLIENRTAEIGIEIILTDQLKNEYSRKCKGKLISEDQADGKLSGRITDVRTWTVARRGSQSSLEKRLAEEVYYRMTDDF